MDRRIKSSSVFWVSLLLALTASGYPKYQLYAQSDIVSRTDVVTAKYIEQDFIPNGLLKNPAWIGAQKVYLNFQYLPYDASEAHVQTEASVLYSSHYLYIGFRAFDPNPSLIRPRYTEHDKIKPDLDDQVGIILDTYNNDRMGYEFFINPKGIQQDLIRSGSWKNVNYDMIWEAYASINEADWTSVLKFPIKELSFPDNTEQEWAINFIRKYPRNHLYEFTWTKLWHNDSCVLCQNGSLTGIKNIKGSNPVKLIPYIMGYQNNPLKDLNTPETGLTHEPANGRVGGTIMYTPTTTSAIDITINPDFSQVESDATEISVNNTFALQYAEKRPFFLTNENLFRTDNDLFYSRTINQPLVAAKFTKVDNIYSLAFLTAYDRNVPIIVPGFAGSSTIQTGKESYDNVIRGKANIGRQSHVGGLITTRNFRDASNYMGSLDWSFYLGRYVYLDGAAAYTNTAEINDTTIFNGPRKFGRSSYNAAFDGEKYQGTGYQFSVARRAKIYNFMFQYESVAPTFQAQHGFITRSDYRTITGRQAFRFYPPFQWYSSSEISLFGIWRYDYTNIFQERFLLAEWSNTLIGQTNLKFGFFAINDEKFGGKYFKNVHKGSINLSTIPTNWLRLQGNFELGRSIYRVQNPKLGKGYNFTAISTLTPTNHLELDLQFRYSELFSLNGNTKYYSGSISRLLALYSFNSKFFFRLITQYDSFKEEIQLYPLMYYKVNPFTKIYLGMTDYSQNFRNEGPPYTDEFLPTNREFFVKIQYLIQK